MPGHTPAPTPGRGIYGFVLFLVSIFCVIIYLVWALWPPGSMLDVGLKYIPAKYWAVAIPVYFCVSLFLFEIFMCGQNMMAIESCDSFFVFVNDDDLNNAKSKFDLSLLESM